MLSLSCWRPKNQCRTRFYNGTESGIASAFSIVYNLTHTGHFIFQICEWKMSHFMRKTVFQDGIKAVNQHAF